MSSHSNENQEKIDTENNGNHKSSNKDGGTKWSLDMLATCPLVLIRSDPKLRTIYDKGFMSGFYGQNSMQSTAVSLPRESEDASLTSPSEVEDVKSLDTVHPINTSMVDAMDTAIESALNMALIISETSSMLALVIQNIVLHNGRP
ncbi:PREDICTED: uncharacterized protein LOC107168366 [Diuraphis noxia]|uniref:uncharacterized protein LOC107168366 n=1 Tax=Diuraphis noxia TaxID=143948 RepID=UPI0007636651|nr:PREDICTED: uncharacterized protein LOC107168366 [Diuraphis noxia]